jgi:hypothetical protein
MPMVCNGHFKRASQGRMQHVFPLQSLPALGSHSTPKDLNPPKPTLTHSHKCGGASGAVGTSTFVAKYCWFC